MLGFLKSDTTQVFRQAKSRGLAHFEKEHRTRALLYFKRASLACPERSVEIAQFYYDNHDYKRACFFYDLRLKAGGAPRKVYTYAVRAYEKRAAMYQDQRKYAKQHRCRAQALAYRSSIAKKFSPPPIPENLRLEFETTATTPALRIR